MTGGPMVHDKVNILLVDDQPGKLLSYEAILGDLGENLLKAGSGRDALQCLLKTEVAVILIDVCMPELDGFQLAQMIRGHPRFRNTAIVFISAIQIGDPDRLRAYELGAVDYVPVPIVPELLRAKVKVFIDLYRKSRQLEQLNADLERRVSIRTSELERSNARLKLALEVARLGTWDWDLAADEIIWSDDLYEIHGYRPGEVRPSYEAWSARVHPEDALNAKQKVREAHISGRPFRYVYRSLAPDETITWCDARAHVEFDGNGKPARMLGIVMDITEHKTAEERQRLMVSELHHRVKNTLATVQAVANLSARSAVDVATFCNSFTNRIVSLSKTHTLLTSANWQAISLSKLLMGELSTFDSRGHRVKLEGPPIELPSDLAMSLGLAFHELTTNAVKYGALSMPSGHVHIMWDVAKSDSARALRIQWQETGGPRIEAPKRDGFGSVLLRRLFAAQTKARVEMEFPPEGFRFALELPLPA